MEILRKKLSYFLSAFLRNDNHFVIIYVWNSGNTSIEKEDYINPLSFNLGKDVQILAARVRYQAPEDLGVAVEVIEPGKVEIPPVYLNPRDRFSLETILKTSYDVRKNMKPYGRIRGAHQVFEEEERMPRGLEFGEPTRPELASSAGGYKSRLQKVSDLPLIVGMVFGIIGATATVFAIAGVNALLGDDLRAVLSGYLSVILGIE